VEGGAIVNHKLPPPYGHGDIDHFAILSIFNSTIEGNFAAEDNVNSPCADPVNCGPRGDTRASNVHQREWNGGGISNAVTINRPVGCGQPNTRPCTEVLRTFGIVRSLDSSTINGNHALRGGGIANGSGGHFEGIVNSTISGNIATRAGGIANIQSRHPFHGVVEIEFSTITKNCSSAGHENFLELDEVSVSRLGAGITNEAFLLMEATILADNTSGLSCDQFNDCFSRTDHGADLIASFCNNLFGVFDNNNCQMEDLPPCDHFGTPTRIDPKLSALNFWPSPANGGPTKTHALLQGSPAINAVILNEPEPRCFDTDQRGRLRPRGPACDIGAFEFDAQLP
jgi:hypothetical protein